MNANLQSLSQGSEVLPIMPYADRLHPKGYLFQTSGKYMKGQGFQEPKYMNGYGNLSLRSVKTQKELQMYFISRKKLRKSPGFVIYSYLKDRALTAVKRDAEF